jgi:hypothetical protein
MIRKESFVYPIKLLITLGGSLVKTMLLMCLWSTGNELENMIKQQLIEQFLSLKKSNLELSNQELESSNQKLESSNQYQASIISNLQRMLFGSKTELFISENKNQLILLFEEFTSQEFLEDETLAKEKLPMSLPSMLVEINYLKTF